MGIFFSMVLLLSHIFNYTSILSSFFLSPTHPVAGAPSSIQVCQASSDSAVVSWAPPTPPTGLLMGYTLAHRAPHASPTRHAIHAHARAHALTRLAKGVHEFWLTASTRVGEGPPTPTVRLTIQETGEGHRVW